MSPSRPRRRLSPVTKIVLLALGVFLAVCLAAGLLLFPGLARTKTPPPEGPATGTLSATERAQRLLDLQKTGPDDLKRWHGEWKRLLETSKGTAAEPIAREQIKQLEERADKACREQFDPLGKRADAFLEEGKPADAQDVLAGWKDPDGLDLGGGVRRNVEKRLEEINLLIRLREAPGKYGSDLAEGRNPGPPKKVLEEYLTAPYPRVKAAAEEHVRDLAEVHFPHAFRSWIEARKRAGAERLTKTLKAIDAEADEEKKKFAEWEERLQQLTRERPISGRSYGLKGVGRVRFGRFDGRRVVLQAFGKDITLEFDRLPGPLLALILESAPDPGNARELYETGLLAARREAYDSAERLFRRAERLQRGYRNLIPSVERLRHGIGKLHADGQLNADQIYLRYAFDRASQARDFQAIFGTSPVILNGSFVITGGPGSFSYSLPGVEFTRRMTLKLELHDRPERAGYLFGVVFQVLPGKYNFLLVTYEPSGLVRVTGVASTGKLTSVHDGRIRSRPKFLELRFDLSNMELRADNRSVWKGRDVPILPMRPVIGGFTLGNDQVAKVSYASMEVGGRCTPKWVQRLHSERRALIEKEFSKGAAALEYLGAVAATPGAEREFGGDLLQPLRVEQALADAIPDSVSRLLEKYRALVLKTKTAKTPVESEAAASEAAPLLDKLVKEAPFCLPALFYRGEWKYFRGDVKGALADLDEALRREEEFVDARIARAEILVGLDRLEDAAKDIERALEAVPDLARGRIVRALVRYHANDRDRATEDLKTAVKLAPKDWELRRTAKRLASIFAGPRWTASYKLETDHYIVRAEVPGGLEGPGMEDRKREVLKRARLGADVLEIAREWFTELVPYPDKRRKKPVVHLFASPESYFLHASLTLGKRMEHSAGYYQPAVRQLFFHRGRSDVETLTTMVHESFHEYMHSRTPSIPPWFDEGLAEYVAAIRIENGKVVETGRMMRVRRETLRVAFEAGWPGTPFPVILRESLKEFMGLLPDLQYAQAWSMVHFLIHYENGKYRPLFDAYLKGVLAGMSPEDLYASVFADHDLGEMRLQWIDYVSKLP